MIDAYLDESGIHDRAAVCVVAGFYGGLPAMKRLEREWKSALKDHHFPIEEFHTKNLIKKRKYLPMLIDLAEAIKKTKRVYPVSFGLVVEGFTSLSLKERKFLTGAIIDPKTKGFITSGCPSKPYFVPFQQVIKMVTDGTPVGEMAHFFFGIDREFAEYARHFHKQIKEYAVGPAKSYRKWQSRKRMGSISFPLAAKTAQLQAADLLAHLTYLHLLKTLFSQDVPQDYMQVLAPCLANTKKELHHVYQTGGLLRKVLNTTPPHVDGWNR